MKCVNCGKGRPRFWVGGRACFCGKACFDEWKLKRESAPETDEQGKEESPTPPLCCSSPSAHQRRESADPFADVDLRVRCDECGEFLDEDAEQMCGGCFKRLKEKEKKWDAIKANPELSPNFVANLFASLEAMRKGDLGQDWDELVEELKREIGKGKEEKEAAER